MPTWTIPQITVELAKLPTWRKKFYWWPTQRWVLQDANKRAFCREVARLSQSIGIGIHRVSYLDTTQLDLSIQAIQGLTNVEWCITAIPFDYVAGSDGTYDWGTKHDQDLAFFTKGMRDNLTYIKARSSNKFGLVFLDCEAAGIAPNGEEKHDRAAAAKLDVYYNEAKQACKDVLGYDVPVVHYGHRAMDLHINWRSSAPVPAEAQGDYPCVPLYTWEDPHLCIETFNRTLAALPDGMKQLIPCLTICGGYVRDFNAWANANQTNWVAASEYNRLGSWLAGNAIMYSPWMNNEQSGFFESMPFGLFWPGVLPMTQVAGVDVPWKYWALHFLSFCWGAAGQVKLPEGEPV